MVTVPSNPQQAAAAGPLSRRAAGSLRSLLPGLAITGLIAAGAFVLKSRLGVAALSPLVLAMAFGALIKNLFGLPSAARPGVRFSARSLLRLGVMLVGLQLTFGDLADVGLAGLAMVAACLAGAFAATLWLGRRFKVDRRLAELIAAGSSICGASAVLAANTVSGADEEDVAYAVACVTAFGSLDVVLYPALGQFLHLSAHGYGLWAGASIHEIAQVAAATVGGVGDGAQVAMVAKLSRVAMLVPVVLVMASVKGSTGAKAGAVPFPWFLLGFLALAALSSTGVAPPVARAWASQAATGLLCASLAAMGLEMDLRKVAQRGWRPLALGAAASAVIGLTSLAWVMLEFR